MGVWKWLKSALRPVGSDPYYANYEKAFEQLEKESSRIVERRVKRRKAQESVEGTCLWLITLGALVAGLVLAWAYQQPPHKLSLKTRFTLTSGTVSLPVLVYLFLTAYNFVMNTKAKKDEKLLKRLIDNKKIMIKELKDSTRFDRTMALIRKYDPDAQQPSPVRMPSQAKLNGAGAHLQRNGPAAAPESMVAGVGKSVLPALDKLATAVIGDNPTLVEGARKATQEAASLRTENEGLKLQLAALQARLLKLEEAQSPADTQHADVSKDES